MGMIYTDSDTVGGGFGFLKLSPNNVVTPTTSSPSSTTGSPTTTTTTTTAQSTTSNVASTTTTNPTTTKPPTSTTKPPTEECADNWSEQKCLNKLNNDKCHRPWVAKNCLDTCGYCDI